MKEPQKVESINCPHTPCCLLNYAHMQKISENTVNIESLGLTGKSALPWKCIPHLHTSCAGSLTALRYHSLTTKLYKHKRDPHAKKAGGQHQQIHKNWADISAVEH